MIDTWNEIRIFETLLDYCKAGKGNRLASFRPHHFR
jgi:hypothetical protein